MIKYSEAELLDLLPAAMKESDDVQAISYAIRKATEKLITFAKRTSLYGDLDQVPEDVLDLIAIELQTQYYATDLDINTKRDLVRNTMSWYAIAGTPSAVEELVRSVFGVGEVVEWFDFDPGVGEVIPGQFDIESNATMTPQMAEDFLKIIRKVKNASSHLRRVTVRRDIPQKTHAVSALVDHGFISIDNAPRIIQEKWTNAYSVAQLVTVSRTTIH